ncbi:MoaB/Mog domain-containing protein [Mycena floridula]|nr:MoaB/Mog domain-containing protein [Mycena floridula]
MSIKVAVLTVSDTAALDSSADRSGPKIREILKGHGRFNCTHQAIVPDEVSQIQAAIQTWVDSGGVDWILSTGGTGFGIRDRTPEAISPLLERQASGIVHLLLSTSLQHTPLAALSRPVAGTIRNTLVITLPGSVKAVTENLNALLTGGVIEHAIELITDQKVHHSLHAGHHHHHHRHGHHGHSAPVPRSLLSHDPSGPASARNRVSPFPLISFEKAHELISANISPLLAVKLVVSADLAGYILAEDVYAPSAIPSTSTTSVDGYALRSSDPPGIYKVLTSQTHKVATQLSPGYVYRINTGGPLPAGADTVIMVEDTKLLTTTEDEEEATIETGAQIPAGENVRAPGSDVLEGDLVLQSGERISSNGGEIGTLAFVGRKEVSVFSKPIVAILSTGNELSDLHSTVRPADQEWGGIWDTNRPALKAALEGLGYEVLDLGIVVDEIQAHVDAIRVGLEKADMLLTTGGTSMGPTDLLKPVIERHFNGSIHFGRVTIKPGKPTTFATVSYNGTTKPIFALPGNPASALVTFHIFVVPALRRLGGWPEKLCNLPRVEVELQTPMRLDTRTEFHRVIIRAGGGTLKAFSTGGQRSSRVASLSGANGLVVLPQQQAGLPSKTLGIGEIVQAILIGELQQM